MILISIAVTALSLFIIYKVVYTDKKEFLQELSEIETSIIRTIYKKTQDPDLTCSLLKEQHKLNSLIGETGEIIVASQRNDTVFFLLDHGKFDFSSPKPIPFNSKRGIPIQYSLKKFKGFIIGPDYCGDKVLAYCDYLPELQWGIVTKIDTSEVNYPFYKAGAYALAAAVILVLIGTFIFRKVSNPLIRKIIQSENRYRNLFEYSALPIWEEDFSKIKLYFDRLKDSGITDFRKYFDSHKEEINHLASLVKVADVNQKSLLFFNVNHKEELITNLLCYFDNDSLEIFKEELISLAEGGNHFECEIPIRMLDGSKRNLLLHLSVLPGFTQNLSRVLVSFIDITARKVAEESLRKSEERFKIIATNTPDNILMQDMTLRYVNVINPQMGFSEAEMVGKTDYDLVSKADADHLTIIKNNVIKTNEPQFIITPITDKDGITQYFEGSFIPKHDQQGNVDGIVGYFRNITERKRVENELRKSEATLRGILDATKESIWLFDTNGVVLLCNRIALQRFGDKYNEIIGKHFTQILPPKLAEFRLAKLKETVESRLPVEFEDERANFIFQNNFYPVFDEQGHVQYVACYSRDITEIKKAEEQLKEYADNLKELNATKDKFFGIIAHDLRNPFSSLLGASEILSSNVREYDLDSIESFSKLSYDAAKSCYALLENLLEWSRSQTGNIKYNPRCISLREIIDENLSVLRTIASNKKIEISSDVPKSMLIVADRDMLKAILRNLLNNALKFTGSGGFVSIHAVTSKNKITIAVKDTGIGIPKNDIDKLFRIDIKYTKIGTNEERGTGLGLLLCKEFVEKHGGRIWVESTEGKGSEFKFTIPIINLKETIVFDKEANSNIIRNSN